MSDCESDGYVSPEWDWSEKHSQQMDELYSSFMSYGEALFGSAFHQLGNMSTFLQYVENTTFLHA